MSPERLAELRRLAEEGRRSGARCGGIGLDEVLVLLDCLEESRSGERRLRDERNRAVRRAEDAEATAVLLREELEDVTAGWFDSVHEGAFPEHRERPLLRAIEGGAGA
jgi:hypothetical protein